MLRTVEQNLKLKGKAIIMVNNGKKHNKRPTKHGSKGGGKKVSIHKPTAHALNPREGITK